MKLGKKFMAILALVTAALLVITLTGSSIVIAMPANSPTPTPEPTPIPSFASFFECIFGVRLFPCTESVGSYTVNTPGQGYGTVSGHMADSNGDAVEGYFVYLGDENGIPVGSSATTDENGYYMISGVAFGGHHLYYCDNQKDAEDGYGQSAAQFILSAGHPDEVINITENAPK